MKNKKTLYLVQAAMIAALYVVLTLIANAFGLASGAIQIRLSEMLSVLPFFTPAAIPGLFVGCLLSNFLTGACLLDDIIKMRPKLKGMHVDIRDYVVHLGSGSWQTKNVKDWLEMYKNLWM